MREVRTVKVVLTVIAWVVALVQIALAGRLVPRFVQSIRSERVTAVVSGKVLDSATIVVPVLNERARIGPCLQTLSRQGSEVREILVVDGGSSDDTEEIVARYASLDCRIRFVNAPPRPGDWNGKAWGLQSGLELASPDAEWIATIDADVQLEPDAVRRLLAFARERDLDVLGVACGQRAGSPLLSLLHPSMLTTLVYRFGSPGRIATSVADVQANGQLSLYRSNLMSRCGGFAVARDSVCEDFTIARHLHACGARVGFYEADGVAETEMHASAIDCLRNWPRSLSLKDRFQPQAGVIGLLNLIFLQALPLIITIARPDMVERNPLTRTVNRLLLFTRVGVLFGTRRAYTVAAWTYWLSPLADPVTAVAYGANLLKRTHTWRGQTLVRPGKEDSDVEAVA